MIRACTAAGSHALSRYILRGCMGDTRAGYICWQNTALVWPWLGYSLCQLLCVNSTLTCARAGKAGLSAGAYVSGTLKLGQMEASVAAGLRLSLVFHLPAGCTACRNTYVYSHGCHQTSPALHGHSEQLRCTS